MSRKIGIIGIGHVGATLAHVLVQNSDVDELILIDTKRDKVTSEVHDLRDALAVLPEYVKITVGDYEDLAEVDVVVSAIGHIHLITPDADRFTELRANAPEVKQVAAALKAVKYKGVLVVITNPNDAITALYQHETGFNPQRVIGTGTLLDTARLHREIGDVLQVPAHQVQGYVLGEHGDSQFVAWSTVQVAGQPFVHHKQDIIAKNARQGGYVTHAGKGYTNVAIAQVTAQLLRWILSDAQAIAPVSHYQPDYDSYLSVPAIVGRQGIIKTIPLGLRPTEQEALQQSATTIKEKASQYQ